MTDKSVLNFSPTVQAFAGCATFVWDKAADRLTSSDTLAGLLEASTAPRNLREFTACFDPDDQEAIKLMLCIGDGRCHPQEMEFEFARSGDAPPRILNIRTQPAGHDGKMLHGLVVDVTRTRQRATDSRTEQYATPGREGQYHYDIRQKLSTWSGSMYRLFDLPAKPVMSPSKEVFTHIHPDDHHILQDAIERFSTTLGPYEASYRIVRADGSIRHVLDRGETEGPIDPKTGLARMARGVLTDLGEAPEGKRADELATRAFDALIDSARFCIYVVDDEMRVAHISEAARPAFASIDNIIGRKFEEVMHSLWPDAFATEATEAFRYTLATGNPYRSKSALEERQDISAVESYDWNVQRITMPDGRYGCLCNFYDLTEMDSTVGTLRDDASTLQMILDNALAFIGVLDLTGTLTQVNRPALTAGGLSRADVIGKKFWQAAWWSYSEESVARLKRSIVQARKGNVVRYDTEVLMAGDTMMTIDFMLSPIHDSEGEVVNIVASGFDITERKNSEARVRLLMGEINHRSKNVLTLVQSIARLTGRSNHDNFLHTFEGRLQALARSYDLLMKDEGRGASLAALARAQLAHVSDLTDGRVLLNGPDIELSAEGAQGLSMAFHELATNAAKHGALSNDDGRVEIIWKPLVASGNGPASLEVSWTERGGPPVSAPEKKGFGSTVLGPMARVTLNAEVELHYHRSGLIWFARCGEGCLAT